jgi:ribose transport system substrate-binding protein/D-allose transport system substrate-binding protein
MVTAGYDAIVLHPITGTNLIECIIKANQEGVLMIDTDGRIDKAMVDELGGEYFRVPIEYFFDQGYLGASAIVDKLGADGGKVAIIEGIAGAPNSEGRTAGAKAAFEAGQNIEIVASHNADFDRSKALAIAQDVLTAHPDLKGVYCANDVMCLAVAEAVDEAGLTGQVLIVGNDFIADALTAIKEGRMYGSVAFSPFVRGEVSLRLAVMAIMGKELPEEMEFLTIVVTPDIADMMDDWK